MKKKVSPYSVLIDWVFQSVLSKQTDQCSVYSITESDGGSPARLPLSAENQVNTLQNKSNQCYLTFLNS